MNQVNKNKSESGFTLVEMLVVISILGILLAVVGVNYGGVQASARDSVRVSDLNQIKLAFEMYRQENGSYPSSSVFLTSWATLCTDLDFCSQQTINRTANQVLIDAGLVLADPLHGINDDDFRYRYRRNGNCLADSYEVTYLLALMETNNHTNFSEIKDRCPELTIGTFGGDESQYYVVVLEYNSL